MLGLPDGITVCRFDLDGVLTRTAKVFARAWTEMFDGYLRERGNPTPFDLHAEMRGKPAADGFLEVVLRPDVRRDPL